MRTPAKDRESPPKLNIQIFINSQKNIFGVGKWGFPACKRLERKRLAGKRPFDSGVAVLEKIRS